MRSLLAAGFVLSACHTTPASQPATAPVAPAQSVVIPEPEAEEPSGAPPLASEPAEPRTRRVTASGLGIEEIRPGSGDVALPGHQISVHYDGTLPDGTLFDSSRQRGSPFVFDLGKGQLIKGFEEGVTGMRVGEIRRLTIPPELGYGSSSPGKIPANASLIFEIELLEVK